MKTAIKNISLNDMANTRNKWAIVALNETQNWSEDIQAKGEKIEGVYLVNLKEPTHLCELAISFPAIFLRNFIHGWQNFDEDELTDLENENGDNDFMYVSGNSKPKFIKYYRSGKEKDILENERCNPAYC